jgi:hypothetical protein
VRAATTFIHLEISANSREAKLRFDRSNCRLMVAIDCDGPGSTEEMRMHVDIVEPAKTNA